MGLRSGRSEGTSRALAIRVAASIDEPVAEVLQELCAEAAAAARAGRLAARFPPGSQFGPLFRDEHRRVAALATSSGAMGDGDTQRAESQLSAIERRRLEEDIEREIEVVQPGARQQLDVCTEILPKRMALNSSISIVAFTLVHFYCTLQLQVIVISCELHIFIELPGAVSALKFAVSHPMLLDTDSKLDRFCAVYKGRPKKVRSGTAATAQFPAFRVLFLNTRTVCSCGASTLFAYRSATWPEWRGRRRSRGARLA